MLPKKAWDWKLGFPTLHTVASPLTSGLCWLGAGVGEARPDETGVKRAEGPTLVKYPLCSLTTWTNLSKHCHLSVLRFPIYKVASPPRDERCGYFEKPQDHYETMKCCSPIKCLDSGSPSFICSLPFTSCVGQSPGFFFSFSVPSSLVIWAHNLGLLRNGELKGKQHQGVAGTERMWVSWKVGAGCM